MGSATNWYLSRHENYRLFKWRMCSFDCVYHSKMIFVASFKVESVNEIILLTSCNSNVRLFQFWKQFNKLIARIRTHFFSIKEYFECFCYVWFVLIWFFFYLCKILIPVGVILPLFPESISSTTISISIQSTINLCVCSLILFWPDCVVERLINSYLI